MKKVYRGLEYHKLRIALILGAIVIICIVACKREYNDVQFKEIRTDTVKTDSAKIK